MTATRPDARPTDQAGPARGVGASGFAGRGHHPGDRDPSALRSCGRSAPVPERQAASSGRRDGLCDRSLHVPRDTEDAVYRRACLRGGATVVRGAGDLSRRRCRDRRGRHRAQDRRT